MLDGFQRNSIIGGMVIKLLQEGGSVGKLVKVSAQKDEWERWELLLQRMKGLETYYI